jgi:hypothetical protein
VTPVSAKETSMITVFSKDRHLHFGKYELIDGKFVTPFEHAEPIPGPLTDKLFALAGEKTRFSSLLYSRSAHNATKK